MNPVIFSEWLKRQGYNVVKTKSSFWYNAGFRVYQAFPYHKLIQPDDCELFEIFRQHHAIGLRFSSPIDSNIGSVSYHATYSQKQYHLSSLDRRTRQNVRNGLSNCRIESITLDRLSDEGWDLEADTSSRQNRRNRMNRKKWRLRYNSAKDLPGFEAWGAIIGNRLVASILTFQMEDTIEMISQQCCRDFLKSKVNNALAFTVTKHMVDRPLIRSVFYTLQSLDAASKVDEFKFRLGFTPTPVRQRVVFHPWISAGVNHNTYAGIRWICERFPERALVTKAEGLFRFYLSGLKPAQEQVWPECLENRQVELLKTIHSKEKKA
jgi:hypothetical protein